MTIPAENLSSKLYAPKTKAPVFALVPTTSDIRLIPVERTNDCEQPKIANQIPIKRAKIYMTQLV